MANLMVRNSYFQHTGLGKRANSLPRRAIKVPRNESIRRGTITEVASIAVEFPDNGRMLWIVREQSRRGSFESVTKPTGRRALLLQSVGDTRIECARRKRKRVALFNHNTAGKDSHDTNDIVVVIHFCFSVPASLAQHKLERSQSLFLVTITTYMNGEFQSRLDGPFHRGAANDQRYFAKTLARRANGLSTPTYERL